MTMAENAIPYAESKSHPLVASDRVEGTAVRRLNGDKVGSIQRVMIDKQTGSVAYAVLRFGGFMGLGEKHIPIPWGALKYDLAQESYVVQLTDEDLAKAPSYATDKEFDWGDRSEVLRVHDFYKSRPYWGI